MRDTPESRRWVVEWVKAYDDKPGNDQQVAYEVMRRVSERRCHGLMFARARARMCVWGRGQCTCGTRRTLKH